MAPLKEKVYQQLHSAKEWLTKAETAFDRENDVRAELNLMLAQAELQHVSEVNRSKQWRYKYAVLRHGLALTLAMCVAVAIGGVVWWTHKPVPEPVIMAGQVITVPVEVAADKTAVKTEVDTAPVAIVTPVIQPVEQTVKEVVRTKTTKAEPVEQAQPTVVVSSDEMNKFVRAAGKSLRGQ